MFLTFSPDSLTFNNSMRHTVNTFTAALVLTTPPHHPCHRNESLALNLKEQRYKGKVQVKAASGAAANGTAGEADVAGRPRHIKRRKTSAAGFFADSDVEESEPEGGEDAEKSERDELAEYLALPQIKYKTEEDAIKWWRENKETFPNLEVMARQYLGCPASSASVERLFSAVGIAFSAKRKSADASTLANIMFANANLP